MVAKIVRTLASEQAAAAAAAPAPAAAAAAAKESREKEIAEAQATQQKIYKEVSTSGATPFEILNKKNPVFGEAFAALQKGDAYIAPGGKIVSKTETVPFDRQTFQFGSQKYFMNDGGDWEIAPEPQPKTLYTLQAGDKPGQWTIPKLRNEKDGGYFTAVINTTPTYADKYIPPSPKYDGDGNVIGTNPGKTVQDITGFTFDDLNKNVSASYNAPLKGKNFSNEQWYGMGGGLNTVVDLIQSGEITTKKNEVSYEDGSTGIVYNMLDGRGANVGNLQPVPGRDDIAKISTWNATAGGVHDVYVYRDPKTGRVAPIMDWSTQVTYQAPSGGMFWQQMEQVSKMALPYAAMLFAPAAGEAIGAALMEAGVLTSASAAAASAATAAQAAAASAAATTTATIIGTGIANATASMLQGKPVDQAIGDAAINTAIQIGTPAAVGNIKSQIAQITSNPAVSNILTNATVSAGTALLKGKNAVEAFEKGGTYALVNQIGVDIPGFEGMNEAAKKVITDAISSKLLGSDFKLTPEYMLDTVIATANKTKTALDAGYDNADQKLAAEEGGFTDAKTYKAADKLGYTNIGEYQDGLTKKFDNAEDYRAAKSGGFEDEFTWKEARARGFTNFAEYDDARDLGIASLDAYKNYKTGEFTNAEEYTDAINRGYSNKAEYDDAMETGWENKAEQIAAGRENIVDPKEYRQVVADASNERSAKTEGYDSAAQRQAAQEGGFPNAATFKVADKAGFTNIAEFEAASNARFNNASDYRGALAAGVETPEEFKQYKDSNYADVLDYRNAAAKGFYTKAEFDDATAKGYSDKATYDKAEDLGFRNASDYSIATANNIDAKTWNDNNHLAVDDGWDNYAEQLNAEKLGFDDPETWKYANAVDLENEGSNITENYLAAQITEIGNDWLAMPDLGLYNPKTGEAKDFNGNKIPANLFTGILANMKNYQNNQFVNRPPPSISTTPTDALSQAAQVIPDYLQDPSQIAKRKERGTPYSTNPEYSVLNPQAPLAPQTQPQQKTQPLALPNPEVVQSGLFSGILSPYNPQQGGPYG